MIEGLIQGIKYEESVNRIWFHFRKDGADVVTVDAGTAKCVIYDPSGDVALAATALTQVGSTAIFYIDVDASDTDVYQLGYNYICHYYWEASGLESEDRVFLDVVKWPFNQPLVSSEEIDEMKPAWAGKKPGGWSTWKVAIEEGHKNLATDLREMRDNKNRPIYPNMILDRSQLRRVEIAYVYKEIALSGIRMTEKERNTYIDGADMAIPSLLLVDQDDDLVADTDDEIITSITLVH